MLSENKRKSISSSIIDITSSSILAYSIAAGHNDIKISHHYLVIDESNAYLIENRMLIKHWTITNISFDEKGGEIITKEGDTISLSKSISIKKLNGEEIAYEYEAIDISQVIINNHYLKK